VGASVLTALHLSGPLAVVAASVVALATGLGQHRQREGLVALWFLGCWSAALLLVAGLPHGLQEIQRLTASSVIGADRTDAVVLGLATLLTAILAVQHRQGVIAWLIDPAFAAAIGLPVRGYALGQALLLGVAVGWSLQVAGLLFVLGGLVLPALAARALAAELATALWLAPLLAVTATVLGSVSSFFYDLPPAQVTVAVLAMMAAAGRVPR
jgi:ABC-type Mn2+/Zn2+ transport system permease subunit